MTFELTILGTSAAVPYHNRWLAGQVLNVRNQYFLIDCGEGTQFRMQEYKVKKSKIDHVFISHLHGDHIFGLFGFLTSLAMNGRTKALTIVSPRGLEEMIEVVFRNAHYISPFPIHFWALDTEGYTCVLESEKLTVHAFPLRHRVPTFGYIFREKPFFKNILPEKIAAYNIPFAAIKRIKQGADYTTTEGFVVPNHELTTEPPKPRSFAYCSDTAFEPSIVEYIAGVDLLYHEATFADDMRTHAEAVGHSTALQAGLMAQKAAAGQLIIGHFSSRYDDLEPLLGEAQSVFANSVLGKDGHTYSVELQRQ